MHLTLVHHLGPVKAESDPEAPSERSAKMRFRSKVAGSSLVLLPACLPSLDTLLSTWIQSCGLIFMKVRGGMLSLGSCTHVTMSTACCAWL